ncbi:MAG: 1,4-alpha-glucan branching protein GlgB [Ardenticatenaceae bacterium]|nr:1,4-alpha-glucan branching protein GlgB [Ardenticatenaceae bacterium]
MTDHGTLSQEEMAAIVGGYHTNPFATLGPQQHENGVVVRTFQPHAQGVFLIIDQKSLSMQKIHDDGLYEIILEDQAEKPVYRLDLLHFDGESQIVEDPYRFLPTIDKRDQLWYDKNGAHLATIDGVSGVRFAVWAPNAERVSVVGTFNDWDGRRHIMRKHFDTGMWDIFLPHVGIGALYKFEIKTAYKGYMVNKTDPSGFFAEMRPKNASIVWDINQYQWEDQAWMTQRKEVDKFNTPLSIYEVHLGSWRRKGEQNEWLTYRDLAEQLVPYAKEMGFTHIELLPVSEHPFDGSWGYQVTGYFAPTSRFGTPDDFKYFVDQCHQNGLGVILDWVPAHFPKDEFGLGFFDGTYLYEHADPRQGEHPDWGTKIFNYGRPEVKKFLIDNALFWLDKYHIDGLRVDAVASMLYLDFSREPGQWVPNRYGGRENIEAIEFLRDFNRAVHNLFPGVYTFAEESTAWPGVTRDPDEEGGLGFDIKWNMGWMNDTLRYMSTDSIFRSYHQGTLTFSLLYAFSEKFVLPFSHDEVVHLKRSMVDKMPGDAWQKYANLRALFAYQFAHPGRKLNFMGNEIAQWSEWQEGVSLDWHLLEHGPHHAGMQTLFKDLNETYRHTKPLYIADDSWNGFSWIDFRDALHSVLVFMRLDPETGDHVIVAANFTPEARIGYRIGVSRDSGYQEFLNTDHPRYGGSGVLNEGILTPSGVAWHDQPYSIELSLPPLAVIYLKPA